MESQASFYLKSEEKVEKPKEKSEAINRRADNRKGHEGKQWYTKHYTENKDRATRTPLVPNHFRNFGIN